MRRLLAVFVVLLAAGCTSPSVPERSAEGSTTLGLARAVHRATTLADGRVLFTGGCSAAGCGGFDEARTSELFDPVTRRFTAGPRMLHARASGTATLLPDGRVLLTGGFPGEGRAPQDTAEVYDPATASFRALPSLTVARAEHTAVLLPDGRVVLAGGRGSDGVPLSSTEYFDPAADRFDPGPGLTAPRAAHAAVVLDRTVLLVGGTSDGDRGEVGTEVLAGRRWSAGPNLSTPRVKHAAIALADGTVLVIGGSEDIEGRARLASTERVDLVSGRVRPGPELAEAQYKLDGAVAALPDDRIVIAGGTRVEVYDPADDSISVVAEPATVARSFVSASVVGDGLVLVAGGYDDRIAPTADVRLVRVDG